MTLEGKTPLYMDRAPAALLDAFEANLNHCLTTRQAKIKNLARLAASKFAQNYIEGPLSWADCGNEVFKLYQRNPVEFGTLMKESFQHFGIRPIRSDKDKVLMLQTVIGQAGLPRGMLRVGKPLRGVIDDLMRHAAQGEDDLLSHAKMLIDRIIDVQDTGQQGKLPSAYKQAGHLPQLCIDLVQSVLDLVQSSGWSEGDMGPIWALPDWSNRLPFTVEEEAARGIVTELLNVAANSVTGYGITIDRVLRFRDGGWRLTASPSLPPGGLALDDQLPDLIQVHYYVERQRVGEAARLRRNAGGAYAFARVCDELTSAGSLAARAISLVTDGENDRITLPVIGAEALDIEAPWVFEKIGNDVYRHVAPAPARVRSNDVLVLSPEGMSASGNAELLPGTLKVDLAGQAHSRMAWRVWGRASFTDALGDSVEVVAGYTGPQVFLDLSGRHPLCEAPGFSVVYAGEPIVRKKGGLQGKVQWRSGSGEAWHDRPDPHTYGARTYRLVELGGEVLAERRRILVLPSNFRPSIGTQTVSFDIPIGMTVDGQPDDGKGHYQLRFPIEALHLDVVLRCGTTIIQLRFRKPSRAAFIDIATGEALPAGFPIVSGRTMDRIVASSTVFSFLEIHRKNDAWDQRYPIKLLANERSIFDIKPLLRAFSHHRRGRTRNVELQFPGDTGLNITAYRIRRVSDSLLVDDADPDMQIELHAVFTEEDGSRERIQLDRQVGTTSQWSLPTKEMTAPLYFAIDSTRQANPCLVAYADVKHEGLNRFHACLAIGDESERWDALRAYYQAVTDNPNDGANSSDIQHSLLWLGDFQHILGATDAFLVLTEAPELAIRMLILASSFESDAASQGMRWALDAAPFSWHNIAAHVASSGFEWAVRHFGIQAFPLLGKAFSGIDLLERLNAPRNAEETPSVFQSWNNRVYEHLSELRTIANPRGAAVVSAARDLRNQIPKDVILRLGHSLVLDENRLRSHLDAPMELALALTHSIEIPDCLLVDFMYAREGIDIERFDQAFLASLKNIGAQ